MKKSIYWPMLFLFVTDDYVRGAIASACVRVGVCEPVATRYEHGKDGESNGNAHSLVDAVQSIDASNADDEDRVGLAQCLHVAYAVCSESQVAELRAIVNPAPAIVAADPVAPVADPVAPVADPVAPVAIEDLSVSVIA